MPTCGCRLLLRLGGGGIGLAEDPGRDGEGDYGGADPEAACRPASSRRAFEVGFFLQFGYPSETEEDIALTFKMLRECKPDDIGISVSYPLPGTKFYETVRAQLGDKQNWVDSEDLALMFRGTFSPDYYRALHKVTHKRFRTWQGLDLLKAWILRPWNIDPRKARRILAAAYHGVTLPAAERRLHMLAER